ncbi:MAG: DUF4270 domain-containing protein [Cellulophaga sp.]|nr:DUF4270 domain-containing protein [Cellulophaga sp.]
MTFYKKITISVLSGFAIVGLLSSCEEEITTIGEGLIGGEPFETGKVIFDVFAYNKKINAVKTSQLPIYQLGNFQDPIYGKTTATIVSQVQLTAVNPIFGKFIQSEEAPVDTIPTRIAENETIKSVFLFIPYLTNFKDSDADGVPDDLDVDPADPNSDTDGDGLTDNQERISNLNPLSQDTDGDGILDAVDTVNDKAAFAREFVLDSIFGTGINQPFNVKVQRSNFFLRDLDPAANFQQSQEYFSNSPDFNSFLTETIADVDTLTVRNKEILIFNTDDPDTEDVDESRTVKTTIGAGIYMPLDAAFFQENILDKESGAELLNNQNFKNYLRGIHISIRQSDDIYMLLNMFGASITMNYTYSSVNTNGTATDVTDDTVETLESSYVFSLTTGSGINPQTGQQIPITGNVVNTFVNESYPSEILNALNSPTNAERIYLKGGAGAYAELKLFGEDDATGDNIIAQIKSNNWIINEASLVFYVDRETLDAAGGTIEPPRLYLFNTATNLQLYNPITEFSEPSTTNTLRRILFYDGLLSKEDDKGIKYRVRITDYINSLVLRDAENVPIGLTLTSDIGNIAVGNAQVIENGTEVSKKIPIMSIINPLGTVLFGSNVDASNLDKKLQLEISYTKAN